tara:strand:+ start:595 stop:876 length:282 start_codon:yes stop_codon:yes gene_type:complete
MLNQSSEKWDRGKSLLLESLYKPDSKLRGCAYNQDCFNEMMKIRDEVIEYVKRLNNPHLVNSDKNDEIETSKVNVLKEWGKEFKGKNKTTIFT